MSYVSTLDLASPEQVIEIQTKLNVFPVPGLPVIEGLRCRYVGCGHLCASMKRMRSHWLANHGGKAREGVGVHWEEVGLQTFFRGNLLRYFTDGVGCGGSIGAVPDERMIDDMNFEVCYLHT